MNIVLDTNCLLMSLSRRSAYYPVWRDFVDGKYTLYVTNEIYHLHLITADPDDDKFVDCAFKANARYIVTEDHHYDVLKQTSFPYIDVVGIDELIKVLRG